MIRYTKPGILTIIGLSLVLSGCMASLTMRKEIAQRIASAAWLVKREIPAGPFALTAYERIRERSAQANLYIEGDGTIKPGLKIITKDPTPKNPVALHLASKDKADNVIYLARPCQYSKLVDKEQPCPEIVWEDAQYAPQVLEFYNAALDEVKARHDIQGFNLIGFSGGGTIATLLAAQRGDVLSLRTVAGNLDHRKHSAYHYTAPKESSLNPPDFAETLRGVPQYHFVGGRDRMVPSHILKSYLSAIGPSNCVQHQTIREASHKKGWVDDWPYLLQLSPKCFGGGPRLETRPSRPDIILDGPAPVYTPRDIPEKP